jgi:hypothetical protein
MSDPSLTDPFTPAVHASIRQAFLLGLARQSLTPPSTFTALLPPGRDPALTLLALAGQYARFAGAQSWPLDPVPEAALRLHQDPRPILPHGARRALARLGTSVEKGNAASILLFAVRRVDAAGCRLHPFDLPDLARHLKGDADSLGLAERAYLMLTATDSEDDGAQSLFFERITADNWLTFPRAHQRSFVANMRKSDPAAGRQLIEGVWKSEAAPVRAALLEALAVGLGPDDKPFLDTLAVDRADTVKRLAAHLLARMPSSEGFDARLAAAAACFAVPSKGGLAGIMAVIGIGGGNKLTFTLPANSKNWAEMQAARERLFAGLPLALLAAAVNSTPSDIIAAIPDDQIVMQFLDTAIADGDLAMTTRIVGARLAANEWAPSHLIIQLADKVRVVVDPDTASQLIAALPRMFDAAGAATKDDGRLIFTASMIPRSSMPAFIVALASLPPLATRPAQAFADLVLALPEPGTTP